MATNPQVRVGVGVFVLKSTSEPASNPSFLIARRKGSHGSGRWALPGGHLEFGETIEQCAAREALEETGLTVSNLRFLTATNDHMPDEGKHYVTMFVVCSRANEMDQPQNLEPEKSEEWDWMSWDNLKRLSKKFLQVAEESKIFLPLDDLFEQRPDIIPRIA